MLVHTLIIIDHHCAIHNTHMLVIAMYMPLEDNTICCEYLIKFSNWIEFLRQKLKEKINSQRLYLRRGRWRWHTWQTTTMDEESDSSNWFVVFVADLSHQTIFSRVQYTRRAYSVLDSVSASGNSRPPLRQRYVYRDIDVNAQTM